MQGHHHREELFEAMRIATRAYPLQTDFLQEGRPLGLRFRHLTDHLNLDHFPRVADVKYELPSILDPRRSGEVFAAQKVCKCVRKEFTLCAQDTHPTSR